MLLYFLLQPNEQTSSQLVCILHPSSSPDPLSLGEACLVLILLPEETNSLFVGVNASPSHFLYVSKKEW